MSHEKTSSSTSKNQSQNNNEEIKGQWAAVGNELLMYFAQSDCTARELKIVFFLLAQLNGWNLRYTPISIDEFSKGTRIKNNHIQVALKSLIEKGLIQKVKLDEGRTYHYGFTEYFYRASPLYSKKISHLKLIKTSDNSAKTALSNSPESGLLNSPESGLLNSPKSGLSKNVKLAIVADTRDSKDILKTDKDSLEVNLSENGNRWPESTPVAQVSTEMSKIMDIILRNKQLNNLS